MKVFRSAALAALMSMGHGAMAQDDAAPLPLTRDIPPSVGYEGREPDILGIHFGDAREDAIATLKAAFPGVEVSEQAFLPGLRDNRGNEVYFKYTYEAQAQVNATPFEQIVLRFTSDATGGRVYQIKRTIDYSDGEFASMKELRQSIAAKYGTPTLVELFPHQNRDEITYTWERRPIEPFPEQDVSKRGFSAERPENINSCLRTASLSAYFSPKGYDEYTFMEPGQRQGDDVCIGAIRFTIFYGNNENTVSRIDIIGTDYDRSFQDAREIDGLLAEMLNRKASAVSGAGAPAL